MNQVHTGLVDYDIISCIHVTLHFGSLNLTVFGGGLDMLFKLHHVQCNAELVVDFSYTLDLKYLPTPTGSLSIRPQAELLSL